MGYDGRKIAELNRLRVVGGYEVRKFWTGPRVAFAITALLVAIGLLLSLLISV